MGDFRRKCREADCYVKQTEPYTPWSNAAEGVIRELKKGVARKMIETKAPKRLWDDCLELEAYIRSHTAHDIYGLEGEVPQTLVSGETPDISEFAEFRWYEWVKYRDTSISFPEYKMLLGRYLGPSFDIGPAMTAKILKENGQYVHRSTYRSLTNDELGDPLEQEARKQFDQKIAEILGTKFMTGTSPLKDELPALGDSDDDVETPIYEPYEDDVSQPSFQVSDADDATPDTYDPYVGAEVLLPHDQDFATGRVIERKRNADGSEKGRAHTNPILDTRSYQVRFPDGQEAEYAANVIAENMYSQCDIDGNQFLLLDGIIDHRSDTTAIKDADRYISVRGRQYPKKTTVGWQLCVQWKDGSTSWERLADLKESNPIEVAEYAVSANIQHEPAFAWWVSSILARRNRIVAAVNKRYHKKTHKFGIEIPKTVERALEIDAENNNTLWRDAIDKEMRSVKVAFRILDENQTAPPPGHQYMKCHMVFDVKMEDFRRKARLVAGGHMTESPATLTYASVVSRESVRIALTLAALNDLEVKTGDIENAYLTAPVAEKIWTTCGPEFGSQRGRVAIIVRALYGLKSAGASFRNHLADCMRELGFSSCLADPDVWYKAETRPSDGHKYYSYVLLYVDDAMCIHHDALSVLDKIDTFFKFKSGSICDPDIYLGAKVRRVRLPNLVEAWAISPSKYIQEAVRNIREHLSQGGLRFPKKVSAPFPRDYIPELDITPELDYEQANFYQSQIGILRWAVELGRIDIITEVSMLASHLALPRQGHLEAVYHIFAYLAGKHNTRLVMDPTYPTIDMSQFKECDWRDFYGDIREPIPPKAPPPRGKEVDLRLYVDSDHAGDKLTRRSRSGFLIYLNMAPIVWYSKKQSTIETSVFGAEFVAMKQGMEVTRGIRYKLRMMGVPLYTPTYIYGDNMSVIHNTQRPESTLKKKSNAICYHAIRESVAMGESLTCHIPTDMNPADICTKVLSGGTKRENLVSLVLYEIFD